MRITVMISLFVRGAKGVVDLVGYLNFDGCLCWTLTVWTNFEH